MALTICYSRTSPLHALQQPRNVGRRVELQEQVHMRLDDSHSMDARSLLMSHTNEIP